jgi:hypothetical protein
MLLVERDDPFALRRLKDVQRPTWRGREPSFKVV